MTRELLIAAGPGEWRAILVEDGEAVELYVERGDTKPPGGVHLGQVVRVVPGLDAALVDIGEDRPGFLPLRDVPPGIAADEGARIVVRVRREAQGDKATRLTARLAAAADTAGRDPPAQLDPPPGLAPALRLRLPGPPKRIVADDVAIVPELRTIFPGAPVEHRDPADWPTDLDAAFEAALAPRIALPGGGAIHIEEARAATLIDVDTGTPVAGGSSARAAIAANLAAARRIARELRLRNIAGGIVVDFVGLDSRGARERVREALAEALASDPARPELLGWTRLGHAEIVRPRRGRSLADAMLEPRAGRTAAKSALARAYEALRLVQRAARATPAARWRLAAEPAIEAALRGPAAPALRALEARLGRPIALVADPGPGDFDIAPI